MTPRTTAPKLSALFQKVEEVSLKAGTKEGNALYVEGLRLGQQQEKWAMASKIVGVVVALIVFVVMDMQSGDYAVILAAVLAVVSFGVAMLGLGMLGRAKMSAQTADWVQRAERMVREYRPGRVMTASPVLPGPASSMARRGRSVR